MFYLEETVNGDDTGIIKGSLVEKLPIYEQDRRVIAQSSHSSVK